MLLVTHAVSQLKLSVEHNRSGRIGGHVFSLKNRIRSHVNLYSTYAKS